ncbi:unnamed protein product [Owenia fusiformis]|uniref:Uncharacterized protein n=1 Tax=Owenia fusiformis TaxID=6347 RepID=A0A8J1T8Y4_OWEFU|nr:unnamed protein product [Owenia fusiformis]
MSIRSSNPRSPRRRMSVSSVLNEIVQSPSGEEEERQYQILGNSRPSQGQSQTTPYLSQINDNSMHSRPTIQGRNLSFSNHEYSHTTEDLFPQHQMDAENGNLSTNTSHTNSRHSSEYNQLILHEMNEMRNVVKSMKDDNEEVKMLRAENERLKRELEAYRNTNKTSKTAYKNVKVKKLAKIAYTAEDLQFNPTESIKSPENQRRRKLLIDIIQTQGSKEEPKIDIDDVYLAVTRLYENSVKHQKTRQLSPTKKMREKLKANNRSRQQITKDQRFSQLRTDEERDLWKGAHNEIMSDEELDTDSRVVTLRRPRWRTEEFNTLINTLDSRLKDKRTSVYRRIRGEDCDRPLPKKAHLIPRIVQL